MIAMGAPLDETLDALLRVIESQASDMLCSIQLFEANGHTLRLAAAPTLPQAFVQANCGQTFTSVAEANGKTAFRGEPIFVADIRDDPRWSAYSQQAETHSLR